jgi:hypothetical protein
MLRVRLLVLVLGSLLATTAARAAAATITVDTTQDTTTSGQCSLRQAIADVDSPGSPSGDCAAAAFGSNTIVLDAATYELGAPVPPLSGGPLSVSSTVTTLTIKGAGEGQTTIDAGALHDTALEISAGANVTLSQLTLTNAVAPPGGAGAQGTGGQGGEGSDGGAVVNQGTLTVDDAAITNSTAGGGGAGGSGGTGQQGGTGGQGGGGGGVYNSGTLTLTGATLSGDQGGAGGEGGPGGADTDASSTGGAGGNGANGGNGGAILNAGGTVTITDSTLSGNDAGVAGAGATGGSGGLTGGAGGDGESGGSGGAIAGGGNGTITITNSTFASNGGGAGGQGGTGATGGTTGGGGGTGGNGGDGGTIDISNGTLTLVNDTIAGNSAGGAGGGGSGGAGPTAGSGGTNGNAGAGGGFGASGTATVQNSLLASNSGGNCGGLTINDAGHNLSFGDASCPQTFTTGDPNLGPLEDNGGPAETISLGPDSAAIDQIPATGAGCPATDERGVARPSGSECDIGAYEVAPPTAQTTAATEIGAKSAQLNSRVTPNAGAETTSVTFDYGTTTKYGHTKHVAGIAGVISVAADFGISGLKPGTKYHYRVTVTTLDGSATGTDRTFVTKVIPALTKLKLKGSTITYRDSVAATITFKVLELKKHGRSKTVATFAHRDKAGANTVKLGPKHLKRGSYTLKATPKFDGLSGESVTVRFKVT